MSINPEAGPSKALLRQRLQEQAGRHAPDERKAASEQICLHLREHALWQRAHCILFFAPMVDEPDVWPLLMESSAGGKTVALPRYSRLQKDYEVCRVEDPGRQVKRGYFGIREPDQTCPIIAWNALDFLLVPGIGFSVDGCRLGRGKGFFDRMLARASGVKCGVAFDWQITAALPVEPHDIRVDCILTPTRWHQVVRLAPVLKRVF